VYIVWRNEQYHYLIIESAVSVQQGFLAIAPLTESICTWKKAFGVREKGVRVFQKPLPLNTT
jgi:hypothetical protein